MTVNFYNIQPADKAAIFSAISEKTGMPEGAVEKDWWVVQTLDIIFGMNVGRHLVFKGGTSLSKAWKLIRRFSEDIDLAIDRTFLGYAGELSKSQRTKLRRVAGEYTTGPFLEELKGRFSERGFHAAELEAVPVDDSDQDPRIIEVHYPSVFSSSTYIRPVVLIEIGCRSLIEPCSYQSFGSLVDEIYEGAEFAAPFITTPTVHAERTFLEKLFLLHEEFSRPLEKMRVDRLSRHLYDIYYLSKNPEVLAAIDNQELYETIVAHRYKYAKIGCVDYNMHNPKTLNSKPHESVIERWEEDYRKMLSEMIYEGNPPSFANLIANVESLKEHLASVSWEFSLSFGAEQNSGNRDL